MGTKIVAPERYGLFECIGGDCPDCCCRVSTWSISVDEDSYGKYQSVEGEFGELLRASLEEKNGKYAFKPFANGGCPMLAKDGLCDLYKHCGPEYLCETCQSYPRAYNWFNGALEASLSLSCPIVPALMLYRPGGVAFMEDELDEQFDKPAIAPSEAAEHRVRAMLFGILQFKGFSLMDKLAYMGLFLRSIDKLDKPGNILQLWGGVEDTIQAYLGQMTDADEILASVHAARGSVSPEARAQLLKDFVPGALMVTPAEAPDVNGGLYQRLQSLKEQGEDGLAQLPALMDKIVVPYVNKNAYVFENYMFYQIYREQFPKGADGYERAFKGLAAELLLLLTLAAGVYRATKRLRDWEMQNVIYLFHRRVSHTPDIVRDLPGAVAGVPLGALLGAFGAIK